ncbi:MAG: hypothetical protein HKO95_05675 [Rhodobacteraceae bacterium]|jgi:hypothetical protein|nr:hypothetical protein [Alphaproteobacteria bacterium]MBT8476891.1 hypothetical protein [Alphaproteobacteria bacterium]NNF72218.1 hypothetical protein [Paracoccaceae bacterium]NNK66206.1 hypothetical protein [Paracoccaceae bacterium]
MTDNTVNPTFWAEAETAPEPKPRHSWPLMGDVASARGGVPEVLIQWRRAQGEDDPAPQLSGWFR